MRQKNHPLTVISAAIAIACATTPLFAQDGNDTEQIAATVNPLLVEADQQTATPGVSPARRIDRQESAFGNEPPWRRASAASTAAETTRTMRRWERQKRRCIAGLILTMRMAYPVWPGLIDRVHGSSAMSSTLRRIPFQMIAMPAILSGNGGSFSIMISI